ncbi:MAG: chromophore lyase CpcT/CpeT [Bacteroidota bacterium]
MKKLNLILILLICMQVLFAQQKTSKELNFLVDHYMSGSFSNDVQSKSDTNFFHISLRMKPIWKEKTDARYIYVEQAIYDNQQKPYRQRIYKVTQLTDTSFLSEIYSLKNPLQYAGEWKKKEAFTSFNTDSMYTRIGCGVTIIKRADNYIGSTEGNKCTSELRGATYATTEVTLMPNMLISWDRGYDNNGKQVWGSEHGGYRFEKKGKLK